MGLQLTRRKFTADEYERMGEVGILGEDDRLELLDGEVVAMSPIGAPHVQCVTRLSGLLWDAARGAAIVQVQSPVRLASAWEPLPDIALLRESAYRGEDGLARPEEILLLIEVADSSLAYDQAKLRGYARYGVEEVWIVNLPGKLILTFREPVGERYSIKQTHQRGQALSIPGLSGRELSVDSILG